jgi:hypothetical protein
MLFEPYNSGAYGDASGRHIWAVISLGKLFLLYRRYLELSQSSDKADEPEIFLYHMQWDRTAAEPDKKRLRAGVGFMKPA